MISEKTQSQYFFQTFNVLIFAVLIFSCETALAQNKKEFKDSMACYPGLMGFAEYEYVMKDNSHFKSGDFTFFFNDQDHLDSVFTEKIRVRGKYKNNLKNDNWKFIYKRFQPTSIPFIDGYAVIHKSDGIEHRINVPFDKGIASGKGSVETNQVKQSNFVKTLFRAETAFENNYFSGNFFAKSDTLTISGFVDENGLFSDEWTFVHLVNNEEIVEKRYYQQGVLVKHEIIQGGRVFEIEHIGLNKDPNEAGEWILVNANKDYFNIILRANIGKINEDRNSELTDLIIENSNIFLKYSLTAFREHNNRDIWKLNNEDTHIYLPKLRVRKFPYSPEEKEQIQQAIAQVAQAKKIVNNFLKDPQVELNKHAYRELALYFEIYSEYYDEILKLEKVLDLLALPSYEYINRAEIMPYIFEGVSYPGKVKFEYQDKVSEEVVDFPSNLSASEANVASLTAHVGEVWKMLKEKSEVVKPIIERNRKRFEIEDKEKELLANRDTIRVLFSNKDENENFNAFHERYGKTIIDYTEEVFKDYAKLPIEQRIEKTENAILCMERFIKAYDQFIAIEQQMLRLKEVYTRVVWNPFTFTDMEETVKERVYNAYKNDLMPFLLKDLESHLTCEKLTERMNNFELVYTRMRDLREQDTRDEERNLRRVHDPKRIIEVLSLEIALD